MTTARTPLPYPPMPAPTPMRNAATGRTRPAQVVAATVALLVTFALGMQLTLPANASGPRITTGRTTGTLEDWANSVLRDVAVGAGRPAESLRSYERVLFLITWAVAEGGGVGRAYGRFNPLNTSLTNADLGGIKTGPNGKFVTVDYPSYDLGVEAAARTIEGRYQNRIRAALLAPNPGAGDLISVLVHPEWTKGNACWACTGNVTTPGYELLLRQVGGQVRTKWRTYATKVLETSRRSLAVDGGTLGPRVAAIAQAMPAPAPAPQAPAAPAAPAVAPAAAAGTAASPAQTLRRLPAVG